MTDWLMVVPAIDVNEARPFFAGCRLPRDRILLIDNATRPLSSRLGESWSGRLMRPESNLGVAGSWNVGLRMMLDEGADWLIVASTSLRFGPAGGLDFVAGLDRCREDAGMQSTVGWHLIAVHRRSFEAVGEFDEGFWPAYWEEVDFLYRLSLAGLPSPGINGMPWGWVDVDAIFGRQAATLTDGLAPVDLGAAGRYYERKWGGPSGAERFVVPFDDPSLTIDWTTQRQR